VETQESVEGLAGPCDQAAQSEARQCPDQPQSLGLFSHAELGGATLLGGVASSWKVEQSSSLHCDPVRMEQSPAQCEDLAPGGSYGKKVGRSSEMAIDDEETELQSSIAMQKQTEEEV